MKPPVEDRHKKGGATPKKGGMKEGAVDEVGKKTVLADHLNKRAQKLQTDVMQFMKFFENPHKKENGYNKNQGDKKP